MGEQTTEGLPLFDRNGAIARITLRRPSKLNRLQAADLGCLRHLLQEVNEDRSVRVLVVTGQGRAFSAGFDLTALDEQSSETDAQGQRDTLRFGADFSLMVDELESLRVPTICRLNGGVYGGATDLALSCDFRIGTTACEMSMPAARLGLHYYTSGLKRWTTRLGPDAAKRFFLLGSVFDAAEMIRLGFLTDLAQPDSLDSSVDSLAEVLASRAPQALQGMKFSINEIAKGVLDAKSCDERNAASLRSEDFREGLAAWREKRSPNFKYS